MPLFVSFATSGQVVLTQGVESKIGKRSFNIKEIFQIVYFNYNCMDTKPPKKKAVRYTLTFLPKDKTILPLEFTMTKESFK